MATTEHAESLDFPGTVSEDCFPAAGRCVVADVVDPPNSLRKWAAIAEQAAAATDATFTGPARLRVDVGPPRPHQRALLAQRQLGLRRRRQRRHAGLLELVPALARGRRRRGRLGIFNHPSLKDLSDEDPGRNWNDFAHVPSADERMVGLEVFGFGGRDYGSAGPPEGHFARALDRGWHLGAVGGEDAHDDEWARRTGPRPWCSPATARRGAARGDARPALLRRQDRRAAPHVHRRRQADGHPPAPPRRRAPGHPGDGTASKLELVTSAGKVVATGAGALSVDRPASAQEGWYFVRARDAAGGVVAYSSPVWVTAATAARGGWQATCTSTRASRTTCTAARPTSRSCSSPRTTR
jgi:hypothetical protein